MSSYSIPDWFKKEHRDNNIHKFQIDYKQVIQETDDLKKEIENGWKERNVQKYLKERPYLFDGIYRRGHGTFIFGKSELSLADKYKIDWVIGSGHSAGIQWDLIELECPQSTPFTQKGYFSEATRKGINQIMDWRLWIEKNIGMAQRPKSDDGLGLYDITKNAQGCVVVGRREVYQGKLGHEKYNRLRKAEYPGGNHIRIISYETLLEMMRSGAQKSFLPLEKMIVQKNNIYKSTHEKRTTS